MKTFRMQKLVRDKIPERLVKRNAVAKLRALSDSDFFQELKVKLAEEVAELKELSLSDKDKLTNELADVQTLIETITNLVGVPKKDLVACQQAKNAKKGRFNKRIFVETVSLQDSDIEWIAYYRAKGWEEVSD